MATVFRTELTPTMLELYWMGLEDLEPPELGKAAARAMRECRFMPVPAELRELAGRGKDARPYHREWQDVAAAERRRIQDSWIPPERQLAAHMEPEAAGKFEAVVMAALKRRGRADG
jgi:hypothetical protein